MLGGLDLKDPRISQVYGFFDNFPPTLLLSGTRDLLLSNTIRIDRKLRDARRYRKLIVYEGKSHRAYLAELDVPQTQTATREIAALFDRHLAQ